METRGIVMTKQEAVHYAWLIATGRSAHVVCSVFPEGDGWKFYSSRHEHDMPRPVSDDGRRMFALIINKDRWDRDDFKATTEEIEAEIDRQIGGDPN